MICIFKADSASSNSWFPSRILVRFLVESGCVRIELRRWVARTFPLQLVANSGEWIIGAIMVGVMFCQLYCGRRSTEGVGKE